MLLGLRWLPVSNSCAFLTQHPKSMQSSRTLFENGEMAVTLPTAALSPPFKALGMSLYAKLLQLANTTFPTGPLLLFQLLRTLPRTVSLGAPAIQAGISKSPSNWKMMLIILSLSSFADQLLRKCEKPECTFYTSRATDMYASQELNSWFQISLLLLISTDTTATVPISYQLELNTPPWFQSF